MSLTAVVALVHMRRLAVKSCNSTMVAIMCRCAGGLTKNPLPLKPTPRLFVEIATSAAVAGLDSTKADCSTAPKVSIAAC